MNAALVNYIEENVLSKYDTFTDGHDRNHIEMVIRETLYLAQKYGADEKIAYVIAAYHDIGIPEGRDNHHLTSASVLAADKRLLEWFTVEQIELMKEAVEDHRASAEEKPRSLYGLIIADADHYIVPEDILRRTTLYVKTNYPELSEEENIERTYNYVHHKYCEEGYLHFHLGDEHSLKGLNGLRDLLKDKERFATVCGQYL